MIQDIQELSASLRYISHWADKLEGLRHHSEETDAGLLSTTSAGPLAEIRRVLLEARAFVDGLSEEAITDDAKTNVVAGFRLPVSERQKVASAGLLAANSIVKDH